MVATTSLVALCIVAFGVAPVLQRMYVNRQAKLGSLIRKYNDYEVANRLLRGQIWQGQTEGQLLDSLGSPAGIDHGLLGPAKREVWKYRPLGSHRFGLSVILENGRVTDWLPKR